MEKIITGRGEHLQKQVNRLLKKRWSITKIEPCKQIIYDEKYFNSITEVEKCVKECRPIPVKIEGVSIQNILLFYDYLLVVLEKNENL